MWWHLVSCYFLFGLRILEASKCRVVVRPKWGKYCQINQVPIAFRQNSWFRLTVSHHPKPPATTLTSRRQHNYIFIFWLLHFYRTQKMSAETQTLVLQSLSLSDSPFLSPDLQAKLRSENPLLPVPKPDQSGKRNDGIAHAPKRLHSLSPKDQKVFFFCTLMVRDIYEWPHTKPNGKGVDTFVTIFSNLL